VDDLRLKMVPVAQYPRLTDSTQRPVSPVDTCLTLFISSIEEILRTRGSTKLGLLGEEIHREFFTTVNYCQLSST
jgi:hypothetical protein